MNYFLINLDRHENRRAHMDAQMAAAGIEAERIAAVDGTKMPIWLQSQFLLSDGSINSSLMPGEVGCYASHLLVCRRIVEQGLKHAVILEDDVTLPADLNGFAEALVRALPEGWDIVRLSSKSPHASLGVADLPMGRSLVRYNRHPLVTGATLVSHSGAVKMLRLRCRVRPIDVEYRYPWLIGLNVYGVEPAIVAQPPRAFVSTIIGEADYTDTWREGGAIRLRERLGGLSYRMRTIGIAGWIACQLASLAARRRYVVAKRAARARGKKLLRPCMPVVHLRWGVWPRMLRHDYLEIEASRHTTRGALELLDDGPAAES
jgi:glycosyl transferase family 25